jgi:hypothetical protein
MVTGAIAIKIPMPSANIFVKISHFLLSRDIQTNQKIAKGTNKRRFALPKIAKPVVSPANRSMSFVSFLSEVE